MFKLKKMNEKNEIEELRELLACSRAELESVNTSTHLGIWKSFYDESGNQTGVIYTEEFRRMLGYTKAELPDTVESLGALIHPDDQAAVFTLFAAASDKTGRTKFNTDYRLLTKSGNYKWFHAAGDCIRFADGTPEEFIGTFSDIDRQKRAAAIFEHDSRRQKAVDLMMLEGS